MTEPPGAPGGPRTPDWSPALQNTRQKLKAGLSAGAEEACGGGAASPARSGCASAPSSTLGRGGQPVASARDWPRSQWPQPPPSLTGGLSQCPALSHTGPWHVWGSRPGAALGTERTKEWTCPGGGHGRESVCVCERVRCERGETRDCDMRAWDVCVMHDSGVGECYGG